MAVPISPACMGRENALTKITSLNLNGIRSATRKGLEDWLLRHAPDVLCVQEVKAQGSDVVGHFDVLDMTEVLEEAYELLTLLGMPFKKKNQ